MTMSMSVKRVMWWQLLWSLLSAVSVLPLLSSAAFLSDSLPLTASFIPAPTDTDSPDPVSIYGNSPITLVFSRPIIALGSDFDPTADPTSTHPTARPFSLSVVSAYDESPVPVPAGRYRWVTTSIARFDPIAPWPTDVIITAAVHADLETYSGERVVALDAPTPWGSFSTQSMQWYLGAVTSDQATAATDNHWDARTNPLVSSPSSIECPPDAVVEVRFQTDVNPTLVASALRLVSITHPSTSSATFTAMSCQAHDAGSTTETEASTHCMVVLPHNLDVSERAWLELPAGTSYIATAGVTQSTDQYMLTGLIPFQFPFLYTPSNPPPTWAHAVHRRLRLWVRHGVVESAVPHLESVLTVTDSSSSSSSRTSLPVTVHYINAATLEVRGEFMPGTTYTFSVGASSAVVDGFGLALEPSDGTVRMGGTRSYFQDASSGQAVVGLPPNPTLMSGAVPDATSWVTYASRGTEDHTHDSASSSRLGFPWVSFSTLPMSTTSVSDLASIVKSMRTHPNLPTDPVTESASTAFVWGPDFPSSTPARLTIDLAALTTDHPGHGVLLQRTRTSRYSGSSRFVSLSNLCANFVAPPASGVTVWVTACDTGAPVSGVSVLVVGVSEWGHNTFVPFEDPITTGSDGTALIPIPTSSSSHHGTSYVAFLHDPSSGDVTVWPSVPVPASLPSSSLSAVLHTDRVIYKPGDAIHVKGYVRVVDPVGLTLSAPESTSTFTISATWSSSGSAATHTVDVSSTTGSFNAVIPVPAEAEYKDTVLAVIQTDSGGSVVGSTEVTVADPRPPTVTMDMTPTSHRVAPNSPTVNLDFVTRSYLGGPSPDASIDVTWSVTRASAVAEWVVGLPAVVDAFGGGAGATVSRSYAPACAGEESTTGSGVTTASTGTDGSGSLALDVSDQLSSPLKEGDSIDVTAVWFGPTGERVTAQTTVTVAASDIQVAVSAPTAPLPGLEFDVSAAVVRTAGGDGDDVHPAVMTEVSFALYAWDGESPVVPRLSSTGEYLSPAAASSVSAPDTVIIAPLSAPSTVATPVDTCSGMAFPASSTDTLASSSSSSSTARCRFTLPAVGKYMIVASATGGDGVVVGAAVATGKTNDEWLADPLFRFDAVPMLLDQSSYSQGDTVTVSFYNPLAGARAMTVLGGPSGSATEGLAVEMHTLPAAPGAATVSVTLDASAGCRGHCQLTVVVVGPRQDPSVALPVDIPTSYLFDVDASRAWTKTFHLTIVDSETGVDVGAPLPLTVGAAVADAVSSPGDTTTVSVTVTDMAGAVVEGAEVAVMVVDKGLLDLKPPSPASSLGAAFDPRMTLADAGTADTRSRHVSVDGYQSTDAAIQRRQPQDPWISPEWQLFPYAHAAVDVSDDEYFAKFHSWITHWSGGAYVPYTPECFGAVVEEEEAMFSDMAGGAPETAAAAPVAGDSTPRGGGGADMKTTASSSSSSGPIVIPITAPELSTRSEFDLSPLFATKLTTSSSGVATVDLTLPDNVGTFAIRVFAVHPTASMSFGGAETSIVSRRAITLQAALPRAVRVGDLFKAGVTARVTGAEDGSDADTDYTVRVTASVVAGVGLVSLPTSTSTSTVTTSVVTKPNTDTPVRFEFKANNVTVGDVSLLFAAVLEGTAMPTTDSLEVTLPVKGVWDEVLVATSLALEGTEDGAVWEEGVSLPAALRGQGAITVTGAVGYLASVISVASSLLPASTPALFDMSGPSVASLAFPPSVLAKYGLASSASDATQALSDMAAVAVARLPALTSTECGLKWYTGQSCFWGPSISPNAGGLFVAKRAGLFSTDGSSLIPSSVSATWESAMGRALVADVQQTLRYSDTYENWWALIPIRLAMGAGWSPSTFDASIADQTSFHTMVSRMRKLGASPPSLYVMAGTVATAVLDTIAAGEDPTSGYTSSVSYHTESLNSFTNQLLNRVRVQGRTAFVSNPYSGYPESLSTQALALIALALSPAGLSSHPLVPKLAHFVATGGETGYGYYSGASASVLTMTALTLYDDSKGSTTADLEVSVTSDSATLLDAHFVASSSGDTSSLMDSNVTPWSDLPTTPNPVEFSAKGSGEMFVALGLAFVPRDVPTSPMYRGLYVQRVIQRQDPVTGLATGPALQVAEPGSTVVVTVQVTTPDQLSDVSVVDAVPACIEPIDPNVDETVSAEVSSPCGGVSGWEFWYWCRPSFGAPEVKAASVEWFASTLQPGTHTVTYTATVVTEGVFALPPTRASVAAQPEVMGASSGGWFVVPSDPVPTQEGRTALLEAHGIPELSVTSSVVACPAACSGATSCDLSTGTCVPVLSGVNGHLVVDPVDPSPPDSSGNDMGGKLTVVAVAVAGVAVVSGVVLAGVWWARRRDGGKPSFVKVTTRSPSPSSSAGGGSVGDVRMMDNPRRGDPRLTAKQSKRSTSARVSPNPSREEMSDGEDSV